MWDLSTECIAGVIVLIILVYSRRGSLIPSVKNRIFQVCLLSTLGSISFNILATFLLQSYQRVPLFLTEMINHIYFIFTPMMGMLYFFYTCAVVLENHRRLNVFLAVSSIPYAVYFLLLSANPWSHLIFSVDASVGYVRGPLIVVTYVVFYVYCAACFLMVLYGRNRVEPAVWRILIFFPLLAVAVIIFQQQFPKYILTGSAAACSLLIIYLYLQNKRISIDMLTGISNRREFLKLMEIKVKDKRIQSLHFILLSVNQFKFINDRFGNESGDRVLQDISGFLKTVVSPTCLFRYNGDQFVILQENSSRSQIKQILSRLHKRLEEPWSIGDYQYMLSASIGVVEYPQVADDMETILSGMEQAIHRAKQDKNNYLCYCTPELLEQLKRRTTIEEILKEYLANDQFEVFCQPIWSVKKQGFFLGEVLLRLRGTRLGPISPGEFIPIAEETGLIIDMTYQIIRKVCLFIRSLQEQGANIDGISVNLSVVQFMQEDLAFKILSIMDECGVAYSKLKLEITESVLIANTVAVEAFMQEMHQKGVRFGLDDFGTGHSNISTVLQLPFDTVKLDKSLIQAAMRKPESADFLKCLVQTFRQIDRRVLAEGVETEEQDQFIKSCCCDYIQGFLYAKPEPLEDAGRLFLDESIQRRSICVKS